MSCILSGIVSYCLPLVSGDCGLYDRDVTAEKFRVFVWGMLRRGHLIPNTVKTRMGRKLRIRPSAILHRHLGSKPPPALAQAAEEDTVLYSRHG